MIVRIRNYIFTGLLVTLPLVVSITILWWVFVKVTNWAVRLLPYGLIIRLSVPIVLLTFLALVGLIARVVFVRKVFGLGEKILIRIPLFNKIYLTAKQIGQAFLSPEKTMFKRVVLVEFPRPGVYSIGFITAKSKGDIVKEEMLHIFVPTTPNPTNGFLLFARPHEIRELDMSVEDGMKLVISGGIITPPSK